MLIITRRTHEVINIGPKENPRAITVTILGFKGNQIRVGIEAPNDLVIDREEVTQRKEKLDEYPEGR